MKRAILIGLITAATAAFAFAQSATVSARVGQGQTAQFTASTVSGEGVLLEIALPDGRSQTFPRLGEELVPVSGKAGDAAIVVRDIDRDGIDEIILRGAVPKRSAVVVFRWDAGQREFAPVDFTDDRDRTTKFLVADPRLPVLFDATGNIEAHYDAVRQDGRRSSHVARFRWNGKAYSQSPDN